MKAAGIKMKNNLAYTNDLEQQPEVKNILVIDDDQDIADSLKAMIEIEADHYAVRTAYTVTSVEKVIETFRPDVILLDIKLGRNNGLTLVPYLREKFSDVIFIIMTAYRDIDYAVKAVRINADEFLYKPIEPANLLLKLESFIKRQTLARDKISIENRFRAVFEQTFQMLFLLDMQGKIIDVNSTALGMIKQDRKDIINKNIWDTSWWSAAESYEERIKKFVTSTKKGDSSQQEFRMLDKNNVEQIWDFSVKSVAGANVGQEFLLLEGRDVTFRKRLEKKLEKKANHDALTGLPNRELFFERTEVSISQASRHRRNLAIIFLDIDHFKNINDTFGHQAGDSVLIEFSNRIRSCLREEDIASRYSGDEFTIALSETDDIEAVKSVAQRIVNSLSKPGTYDGKEIEATVSMGIALYPGDGVELAQLIKKADSAMYLAKKSGKNQYKFYNKN